MLVLTAKLSDVNETQKAVVQHVQPFNQIVIWFICEEFDVRIVFSVKFNL